MAHGNLGRIDSRIGQRHTLKGRKKQEREDILATRIATALRGHNFKVETLTQYEDGLRTNGASLCARCSDYCIYICVVLPGRKPDMRQRAALADKRALAVHSVTEALRLVSVGILIA